MAERVLDWSVREERVVREVKGRWWKGGRGGFEVTELRRRWWWLLGVAGMGYNAAIFCVQLCGCLWLRP